jgi:hypothetical protein
MGSLAGILFLFFAPWFELWSWTRGTPGPASKGRRICFKRAWQTLWAAEGVA